MCQQNSEQILKYSIFGIVKNIYTQYSIVYHTMYVILLYICIYYKYTNCGIGILDIIYQHILHIEIYLSIY